MLGQWFPAAAAVVLGVVVGMLLFVPFVAVQYRRHGRLTAWQTLLWAAFLVYALALWTYTLLPLPNPGTVRCLPAQTVPFTFVDDILRYPADSVSRLVRNPAVLQVALNVCLFVPLGFFLRMVWRRGFLVATGTGLAISLVIELTQLTGVWGIYPCAYRLFDVDDLIANTTGAALGGLLSRGLNPWLARRAGEPMPSRPQPVTIRRRLLGMLCDALSVWLVGSAALIVFNLVRAGVVGGDPTSFVRTPISTLVPFVVLGALVLVTGGTVGDHAVLLRWEGGVRPQPLARALRYLAGIGGWQLLAALDAEPDQLFLLVSVIALLVARRRGGLPGVVSRMRPVDARAPVAEGSAAGARER
jgi:Glycopeptide antibiotics resistance protein